MGLLPGNQAADIIRKLCSQGRIAIEAHLLALIAPCCACIEEDLGSLGLQAGTVGPGLFASGLHALQHQHALLLVLPRHCSRLCPLGCADCGSAKV